MFINSLFSFHVTILFLNFSLKKTFHYQESNYCQYQLRDVNVFVYICRRLSHTTMTGSEAVDKYIYVSERPPDNPSLQITSAFLSPYN